MVQTDSTIKVLSDNDSKFKKAFAEAAAIHEVGVSVKRLRESLKMTQGDFAHMVGTSKSTIVRIESGTTAVSVRILAGIAHSVHKSVNIRFI
jgi:DNA-binding XRE family transcriptional regulator